MHYRRDLAYIHHSGFSDFARHAAPFVVELLHEHNAKQVVEIGCGTGILARELQRAGFDFHGFDASPAMIELARETVPQAHFEVAPFESANIPATDAIIAMGEVLNYGDIRTFLPRAANGLRENGVLLFDIAERGSYPPYDEHRIGGEDWSAIVIKESDGATLTRRVLTFREVNGETHRDEEVHTLELYAREELLAMLDKDFKVRVRRGYGRRQLPKGHAVYVCVRRSICTGSAA